MCGWSGRGATSTSVGASGTGLIKRASGHFSTGGDAVVNGMSITFTVGARRTRGTRTGRYSGEGGRR